MKEETLLRGSEKINPPIQMDFDNILKDFGIDKDELTREKPELERLFTLEGRYKKAYKDNPSDILRSTYNNYVSNAIRKLKEMFPEKFEHSSEDDTIVVPKKNPIQEHYKNMEIWVDAGDNEAITDWFGEEPKDMLKRVLSLNNYELFDKVFKSENILLIDTMVREAKHLDIYSDVLTSRGGTLFVMFLKTAIKEDAMDLMQDTMKALRKNPTAAKKTLQDNMAYMIAIEENHKEAINELDIIYEELGMKKPSNVAEEALGLKKTTKWHTYIQNIRGKTIEYTNAIITRGSSVFEFSILEAPHEIKEEYHMIYPVKFENMLSGDDSLTQVYADKDVIVAKTTITEIEKHIQSTKYEILNAWINMLSLPDVSDVLAILYISNFAMPLLVDEDNVDLQKEYQDELEKVMRNPKTNTIGGKYMSISKGNLKNLTKYEFLDNEGYPTNLMYLVVGLHAYSFPPLTHPFEYVTIPKIQDQFTYELMEGSYHSDSFLTDGELLYYFYNNKMKPSITKKVSTVLTETARTLVLNMTSDDMADVTKYDGNITAFLPLIYAMPTSKINRPSFELKMQNVPNRKVMWGTYVVDSDQGSILTNSYTISSIISGVRGVDAFTYEGKLSNTLFAEPREGVILNWNNNTTLAQRGLNWTTFFEENYTPEYYQEVLEQDPLEHFLDNTKSKLSQEVYGNNTIKVNTVYPKLTPLKAEPKLKPPAPLSSVIKQPKIRKVHKPDERVYLTEKEAKKELTPQFKRVFDEVKTLRGEDRDEAVLGTLLKHKLDKIAPANLLYLGFDLEQWAITDREVVFKNYELRMPNLDFHYYINQL